MPRNIGQLHLQARVRLLPSRTPPQSASRPLQFAHKSLTQVLANVLKRWLPLVGADGAANEINGLLERQLASNTAAGAALRRGLDPDALMSGGRGLSAAAAASEVRIGLRIFTSQIPLSTVLVKNCDV